MFFLSVTALIMLNNLFKISTIQISIALIYLTNYWINVSANYLNRKKYFQKKMFFKL